MSTTQTCSPARRRSSGPLYIANLVSNWIPALDGVEAKLAAGGRVADVGCGLGASSVLLAQAYPDATIVGSDYHRESIDIATEPSRPTPASRTGHRSKSSSAQTFSGSGYDLVATFDCLHDMGDPLGAARHIREALATDGTWLIVEPYAGDAVSDNLNPLGRMYYSASSFLCVPNGLSQPGGYSLGAQAGERRIRQVVTDAGIHPLSPGRGNPVQPRVRGPALAAGLHNPKSLRPGGGAGSLTVCRRGRFSGAAAPDDERGGRAAGGVQLGVKLLEVGHQLGYPRLQRVDMGLELDDAFDAGEVHALVLRESLHLAQQGHIARRIAPPAADRPARGDQAEPVVLTQRLGVHARPARRRPRSRRPARPRARRWEPTGD